MNTDQYTRTTQRKSHYKELLNKVETIEESNDVGLAAVNEVGEILKEANILDNEIAIEERVGNADETVLDCLVLSSASGILKRCIEAVDVFTSTYDGRDFADKILHQICDQERENIDPTVTLKLLDESRKTIPNLPEYKTAYGSYDLNASPPVPKQRKENSRVIKEKLQKKEPEKINNLNKEESIEKIVKVLFDVLAEAYIANQEVPISYYDYIIDTSSYPNTIENIFYFAFLVRDGKVKLDLDKSGSPVIQPIKKKDLKAFRDEGGKNSQIISSINMNVWKKFKKDGLIQRHKTND
ncbi:non-structural maintenance of chromosomes element 4 homolog A-like [Cylas formicarius]|uniref:non-structural maintenance of chromosomes element 4 homolog A-like n=1 Tax=Cylas formicarius TaxID=197179 RepID=UPI0029586662|nr:non-structural maintenance of chromosomes element 4 homolog A-like [Cylas formicarius]